MTRRITGRITRRGVLGGLAALAPGMALAEDLGPPFHAPRTTPLPRRRGDGGATRTEILSADALVAAADLGGTVGFTLIDIATGAVLEARMADAALPPASTAKAITAGFVAERLGLAHRFETQLVATGPVAGGVVQGDLVLSGGGDPTLDTDRLAILAAALSGAGVRGVTGRFLLWSGARPALERIDTDQPDHVGYNPALSGLNLNFNRVHFEWRRAGKGWNLGFDARGKTLVPKVSFATMQLSARERPLFTYARQGEVEHWTVAEPALGKGGARWLPTRMPAQYAGAVFCDLALAQGIKLPAPTMTDAPPMGEVLARDRSEDLAGVLRGMLEHSTNITAELVGLAATGAGGIAASAAAMTAWAGPGFGFVDHSGLGAGARVTPQAMAQAMARLSNGPLPALLKDHGMRDAKGKRIDGHPVQVRAKTGTLNFASALTGIISLPSGRRMAFATIAADLDRRAAIPPDQRENPEGNSAWTKRARLLQARLIERWAAVYA